MSERNCDSYETACNKRKRLCKEEIDIDSDSNSYITPDIHPTGFLSIKKEPPCVDDSPDLTRKKGRKFNIETFLKWKQQYKWLREEDGKLICTICRQNEKAISTSFVKGCRTFKLEAVKIHETSEVHQKSCLLYDTENIFYTASSIGIKNEPEEYHDNRKMKGLVLGVYTEKESDETKPSRGISGVTNAFKDVDEKSGGKLSDLLKSTGPFFKSAKQKLLWVPTLKSPTFDYDCVSVVDLGSKDVKDDPLEEIDQKAENVRCAVSGGVIALDRSSNFDDIYLDSCGAPQSVSEAAVLSLYSYDELKTKANKHKSNLHLYEYPNIQPDTLQKYEKGILLAESQNFARTLMQTPANYMTPTIFASKVEERFKGTSVKVLVRFQPTLESQMLLPLLKSIGDQDWIESMKMGSFLSVTRGSIEKPKFLELHYEGLPGIEKNIAFVGKGITFDSGGISLKPSADMDKMRADMGGAACVTATILAASALGLKVNVKGFMPLCENMPSGHATKPGDVVRAMNGKTIQVDNTDAEGRLVLADGLCYAQQFKPMAILDLATLTGAMIIALGRGATGVFSNDKDLWEVLHKAGYVTGDRVWRMPLFKHYTESVTSSDLADLNNIGNPKTKAQSCTAAAFLKEFIEPGMKWMHLDIAGVMQSISEVPYMTSTMSGRPTRTLVQFLQDLEGEFAKK